MAEFTDELRYPIKAAILAALDAGVEHEEVREEAEHHVDQHLEDLEVDDPDPERREASG